MSEEVTLRAVKPADAAALLKLLRQLGQETPFLLADATDLDSSVSAEAAQLQQLSQTTNNLLLVVE
ncbi:MAG: GspMb/PilO family protein, partial [Loigolactobacillus coryniformis]